MSCVCDIMYSKGNLASVLYTNVSIEERSTDDDCPDRARLQKGADGSVLHGVLPHSEPA